MGRVSGLWAASFWSIVSLNLPLQANQPNTEVFINACMIWIFVIFLGAGEQPVGYLKALWLGALAALATLFKHHAFLPFAGISVMYVIGTADGKRYRGRRFFGVLTAFGVILISWLVVGGYFWLNGRFGDFYDAVFRHNMSHAGDPIKNLIDSLEPERMAFMFAAILPSGLAIMAYFAGMLRRQVYPFMLMIGLVIGTDLAVASTKWWFPHYFQLWLPGLCVMLGWSYVLLVDMFGGRTRLRRLLPAIGIGCIVLPVLANQLLMYRLSPEQWLIRKYGVPAHYYVKQAEEINRILKPQESFYHFGDEVGLYYVSKRRPPVGVFWYYPLFMGPLMESLSKQAIGDLERSKPDMVVTVRGDNLWRYTPRWNENPIIIWCEKNYVPFPDNGRREYYMLFARRGSELEKRVFSIGGQRVW